MPHAAKVRESVSVAVIAASVAKIFSWVPPEFYSGCFFA